MPIQISLARVSAIAAAQGSPTQKIRDAVRTFAARAMRGRRLAYGLIFEPIDPEVESTRLKYRRAIAQVFGGIISQGIAVGEFREQDVDIAGACVVGAFVEGLIGSLAPDTGGGGRPAPMRSPAKSPICVSLPSRTRTALCSGCRFRKAPQLGRPQSNRSPKESSHDPNRRDPS
jgi:hypothetical protein